MLLIAQNHLQLIIEIGIILIASMIFIINLVPLSLSVVTFLSLFLSGAFMLLFAADILMLFLSFGQNEFTHPFGPLALACVITALSSMKVMEESGVNVKGLKKLVYLIIIGITVFGGMMHRSFLTLWILGLFIGYTMISKSFRQKSVFTLKRIFMFLGLIVIAFGLLQGLSMVLNMPIFSPMLRIARIETYSGSSIKTVLANTQLIGHNINASYWSNATATGFAEGYISLPMQFILFFGLPYPVFFGTLVNQKDTIDYMLSGIFGYAFDFGYLGLIGLIIFVLFVIVVGLKVLTIYRQLREKKSQKFLGREVLLIGCLSAFIAQTLIGCFIFNRTINGLALLTFLFLAALVLGHSVVVTRH
ncbi:hypothetical protein BGI41_06880 [Methanobrevibacter sp. 87.7]|uniref:hypothetical protein n=1 Tax=Methanobrevibacter sp. 87.7 TaxID=387957 RepID=UPI000B5140ED|nr:hypothetical protein [Methanobrevibacter sp. 87.7]OWT32589.1 hypothetical protein BGI41_06880 [Methanobrevibacter sp. 87.7]